MNLERTDNLQIARGNVTIENNVAKPDIESI